MHSTGLIASRERPSFMRRVWRAIVRGSCELVDSFREPSLEDHLPPIPEPLTRAATLVSEGGISAAEGAERLLIEAFCAPPEYLHGLADVVDWARQLQESSQADRDDALVRLAIARIRPDHNGEIPIVWVERKLGRLPSDRLLRSLERLARRDHIALLPERAGDVGLRVYDELGGYLSRVKRRERI